MDKDEDRTQWKCTHLYPKNIIQSTSVFETKYIKLKMDDEVCVVW